MYDTIKKLNKEIYIRKLISLILVMVAITFAPMPPERQKALADIQTPVAPKTAIQSNVQPVTAVPVTQPVPTPTPTPTPIVATPMPPTAPITPTTHEGLMATAGISPSDYTYVDYIVSHESGWDADATEPTSGAHGLTQALPYSKTGCGREDAVCQLQWSNRYATARYGSWYGAYIYWKINHNW